MIAMSDGKKEIQVCGQIGVRREADMTMGTERCCMGLQRRCLRWRVTEEDQRKEAGV